MAGCAGGAAGFALLKGTVIVVEIIALQDYLIFGVVRSDIDIEDGAVERVIDVIGRLIVE